MSRVSVRRGGASSRRTAPSVWKLSNGTRCRRCRRFGVYAPGQLVCCSCLGWLPLIYTVVVLLGGLVLVAEPLISGGAV